MLLISGLDTKLSLMLGVLTIKSLKMTHICYVFGENQLISLSNSLRGQSLNENNTKLIMIRELIVFFVGIFTGAYFAYQEGKISSNLNFLWS